MPKKKNIDEWAYHCGVVGVPQNSTKEEIRRAYLFSAHLVHPDKHGNSPIANARFQQLTYSYQYLLNNFAEHIAEPVREVYIDEHYAIFPSHFASRVIVLIIFTCIITVCSYRFYLKYQLPILLVKLDGRNAVKSDNQ